MIADALVKAAYYAIVLGFPALVIALCVWVARGGLDRAEAARRAERKRCADIVTKFRGEAYELENLEESQRLVLVLGLIRGEINGG